MAGTTIKGITISIGGETTGLQKSLKEVNAKTKDISSELKSVERLLKFDPENTVLLAQKQELLSKSVENTKDKLGTLKEAEKQVQEQFKKGEVSEEQYRALQREIAYTESSLKNVEEQAIKSNAVLSKDQAVGNLKNMATVAAGAGIAVGAAFVGMAAAALENADEMQRQADVTGLSAERLQELQYAGNNLGVELDTITGAQTKLIKSMDAAREGTGTQAEAFAALGVSVLDSNGNLRDSETVMNEALTALGGVGNEAERNALAMEIFGKSAMDLNPIITAGGDELSKLTEEARNNGSVMSNEAIAGLDTFGDTVDNLKNAVLGSFGEKFAEMLPKIQEFLDKLKELPAWIQENATKLEIIGVIIGTITALIIAFNIQQALMAGGLTLWSAIAGVATAVTTALGTAMAFLISPIALVIAAIGAVIAIGILLYKNWDTIKQKAGELWDGIKATFSGVGEFFAGIWQTIKDKFSSIGSTIGDAIGGAFKTVVNAIINFAEEKINGFIGAINLAIGLINKIPGVNISKLKELDIPALAKGGIVTGPTTALIGEAGAEAVIPLSKIDNIIASALSKAGGSRAININNMNVLDKGDQNRTLSQLEFLSTI